MPVPLLVVIDDVDRLTPMETQQLFQLVKANADFANLVYLLLFQRDTVEKSLHQLWPGSGRDFLEKIIQVGFDVPVVDRQRLDSIFAEKLNEILVAKELVPSFDRQRWGELFRSGLGPYFTSLRDVYRLLSSLSFHLDRFRSQGALDVNVVDLIALDVLRVFEPDVYTALPRNRDLLTGSLDDFTTEADRTARVEQLLSRADADQRLQLTDILGELFPVVRGARRSAEADGRWRREVRVCSADIFPRYFRFSLTEEELSQADVRRLLDATASAAGFREALLSLTTRNLLVEGLIEMDARRADIRVADAAEVIQALCDIGDDLPHVSPLLSEVVPDNYVVSIIVTLLRRIAQEEERLAVLRKAIDQSIGLYLPVLLIDEIHRRLEDGDAIFASREKLDTLKTMCATRLREAGAARVSKLPALGLVLSRWKDWGHAEEAKTASEQMLATPETTVALVRGFAHRALVASSRDEPVRVLWSFDLGMVESIVPVQSVENALLALMLDSLEEGDRAIVEAFQRAVEGGKRGISSERGPMQPRQADIGVSSRRERPAATEEELTPVMNMVGSDHEDVQVVGLTRLGEMAPRRRIEERAPVLSLLETTIASDKATVQIAALRAVASLLLAAGIDWRSDLVERFLPAVLELVDSSDLGVQLAAVEAAARTLDDRAVVRLIQHVRDEQIASSNNKEVPRAAYSLRNMRERKEFILAELRRQIVNEPDDKKRQRLIVTEELVRQS